MNMKKITLALAGVVATVAFAPEASALPVFARQVGMACSACHFQHYPLLNAFGRAFKASGFTMGGAQANIEGDGLSLPSTINASFLISMGYEKSNADQVSQAGGKLSAGAASTGAFYVGATGGEASLFLGGRGSDFMGYLTEITLGGGAGAVDSLKTPILFDINGTRAGVVFFSTNGQGVSYGFETLNTGANAVHSITNSVGGVAGGPSEFINAVSAQQWLGTASHATGASLVAVNEKGFINITKWDQIGPDGVNLAALSSTYLRAAATFDLSGWDSAVGIQSWSGNSMFKNGAAFGFQDTKATALDAQFQGSLGDKPVGVYVTYATAPKSDASVANAFNASTTNSKSSFNIAAEVGVIPEKATIGAAVRFASSGIQDASGSNTKDNAIYLTGTYKLAQNLITRLSYVHNSGSYWDQASGLSTSGTNAQDLGTNLTQLNLYALF
jgi:hypothetical protein